METKRLIPMYVTIFICMITVLITTGCTGIPKSDKLLGIFMTYGDNNYGFVDPEKESVFVADISQNTIEDKKGNALEFEDLKHGDVLEFHGAETATMSLPPIYTGITKVVRIKEGGKAIEKKYNSLVEEELEIKEDSSEIPMVAVEAVNELGYVTTGISAVSFSWEYENEDGKKEQTKSSEAAGTEYTTVELDKDKVEANIYISSAPQTFELLEHTQNAKMEVKLTKTSDGYQTVLKPGSTYEINGTWDNGEVCYKFFTVAYEK